MVINFSNIDILENTYVNNLILDTEGHCLGTINLSTPNEFESKSHLKHDGKLLIAGGYLGTTRLLSNLKQTIPQSLSNQLNDVGKGFGIVPSFILINIIPNLKDEFKFSRLPNKNVNGPSFAFKYNGPDNKGEYGINGCLRLEFSKENIILLSPLLGIDINTYTKMKLI